MNRIVVLQNKDFRIGLGVSVVGRSGKSYGTAKPVPQKKLLEFRMPFSQWQKCAWDIAQGSRRAGHTFFVADIIDCPGEPPIPPSNRTNRENELSKLSFRALRSIAKSKGVDVVNINKSPGLLEAILKVEFP